MKLLAFDTTGTACSAAALDVASGVVRARRREDLGRGHAEALVPMIEAVLSEAGWAYAEADVVAVCAGPGSFTGCRVGVAAARALALAADLPIVTVTSLEATAEAARAAIGDRPCLAVLDARRGQVYAQLFEDGRPLGRAGALSPMAAAAELTPGAALAGSGGPFVAAFAGAAAATVAAERDASDVARVAARRLAAGGAFDAPEAIRPVYLRAPDARPMAAPPDGAGAATGGG